MTVVKQQKRILVRGFTHTPNLEKIRCDRASRGGFTPTPVLNRLRKVSVLLRGVFKFGKKEKKSIIIGQRSFAGSKLVSGFTLLEMLVAVTLFTVITTMSIGSLVTVFDANRKTQSLRTVMENLNFTMEGMSREIKFGTEYYCRDSSEIQTLASISSMETARSTAGAGAGDCSDKNAIAFKSQTGHYLRYTFNSVNSSGLIEQSIDGGSFTSITAPEIDITRLAFFVLGSSSTDNYQPRTTISISGHTGLTGSGTNTDSSFNIQTTVSQRELDQN